MKAKLALLVAVAGLLVSTMPVLAHHSFAAEYDANNPVTLKGTVTKIEWTNPHARFYLDVKGADGALTNWNMELASPNALQRNGWTRRALNVGDERHSRPAVPLQRVRTDRKSTRLNSS